MSNYLLRPIPDALVAQARVTLRSPQYGHPAHRETATGTGPCRSCLAPFDVGADDRLLFTYDPFAGLDFLPLPGPVFVHADGCEPHAGAKFPTALGAIPLVAEVYRGGPPASEQVRLERGAESVGIALLMNDSSVRWLHLRHAQAGCFIARVERVPADA